MEDLLTMLRIAKRHGGKLLALASVVSVGIFLVGGARLDGVDISPDDAYRVEYYTPRHYQRLLHWKMDLPSFVRLYRNTDNKYFGESAVVDFFGGNGGSMWMIDIDGRVRVGRDIEFTGVPPVTSSGEELPIPNPEDQSSNES